ncbi:MAG: DUF4430 domain-containing protein [Candidatus Saccharimonadales bacterium]
MPLGAGLLIITLITALGGIWQYGGQLDGQLSARPQASAAQLTAAHQNTASKSAGSGSGTAGALSSGNQTGTTAYGTVSLPVATGAGRTGSGASSGPAYSQTDSTTRTVISVRLTINGHGGGTVKLTSGSDQCDVLSQALAEGVISSLDMRYDSSLHTEGVYVIDGIGSPDTVWWTYTVNAQAPPYGCSYVTAHNGDSVNWQYVKS